jgi:tripartite-type tricarboxylate transporter receptor subunit TctC
MACVLFNAQMQVNPTMVGYRGTGPAVNDLVGGHIDFICEQSVSVAEQIKSGTVKGYVTAADERLASLPDVPSAKEMGVDYKMSIWAGIFAPKGTPPDVVKTLASALDKALDDPGVTKRLRDLGGTIPAKAERSPDAFEQMVKAEMARWSAILQAAKSTTN